MNRMKKNTDITVSIFVVLVIFVIIVGLMTMAILFYNKIRVSTSEIQKLRACGMSLPQFAMLIARQCMFYPLIGIICAVIPACALQSLFMYIRKMIDSGKWDGISMGGESWYQKLPFRYNLFSYNPVRLLIIISVIYLLFFACMVVPHMIYIRNHRIVEDIEYNEF